MIVRTSKEALMMICLLNYQKISLGIQKNTPRQESFFVRIKTTLAYP